MSSGSSCMEKSSGVLIGRPDDAVRLVGTDEGAAALLAHVDLAGVVGGVDDLALAPGELRNVLGDQVVMLHGQHRQLDAHHVPDLARPQPAAVHHVLGMHGALVGHDIPGAIAALRRATSTRVKRSTDAPSVRAALM